MNIKNHTLIQIGIQSEKRDLNSHLNDFHSFIDTLILLQENIHAAKVKAEPWKKYFEVQLFKYSLHASSLAELFKGTVLKNRSSNKELRYSDIGSIYLLSRAIIENYLMFYYLNVQPRTFDEGEFRCLLYDLSGLNHRQKYNATLDVNIEKLRNEKKEIEIIIDKIRINKFFLSLPRQKQNELLSNKPPRCLGWEKLIEESHLRTEFFLTTWKLYSNYAHSEMISAMQIRDYVNNPQELDQMIFGAMEMSFLTICVLMKDLTKMFKAAEITYNSLPISLTTKIDFWARIGTHS